MLYLEQDKTVDSDSWSKDETARVCRVADRQKIRGCDEYVGTLK